MKNIIFSTNLAIRAFKKVEPKRVTDYHIAYPNSHKTYYSLKSVPNNPLTSIIAQPRFKCINRTFCIKSFTNLRNNMSQRSIA